MNMNINGLGSNIAVENGRKASKSGKWDETYWANRCQGQRAKRDSYEKTKEEMMYALTGGYTYSAQSAGGIERYEYYNIKTINRITQSGRVEMSAVIESQVRNLSYMDSDHVQVNVAEGYTYRAKVDMSEHSVYVEYRDDGGCIKGYVASVPEIEKDTEDPVEQMALASWNKVLEENRKALGFTEYKQPFLAGETVPGTYVNGCFISEKTTHEDTIYLGKFGDACGMAGIFGGSWSDYYPAKEGQAHQESIEVKLFTGRTVVIDVNRISQMSRLKGVLSKAEYAQLEEAVTNEAGSVRMPQEKWEELLQWTDQEINKSKQLTKEFIKVQEKEEEEKRVEQMHQKKVPYAHLADDSGVIVYNGTVFVCDEKTNSICLGDMSNPNDVLTIPLSRGGCLKVNRNNFDDLARAITMFSAQDRNLIMRAIQQDKKVQQLKQEIEDEKSSVGEKVSEQSEAAQAQNQGQEQNTSLEAFEAESGGSNIVVKPDGTRILVVTTMVGGVETQMSIKLSDGNEYSDQAKEEQEREEQQKEEQQKVSAGMRRFSGLERQGELFMSELDDSLQ